MINSIIESIASSLKAEFGDGYACCTEAAGADANCPCFFISCVSAASRSLLGKRYFRENQFRLQYFPADKDRAKEECNAVAERLFSCLEYISVAENFIRGMKMKYEVAEGVLSFFVNYDLFVYRTAAFDAMEEISQNVTVKG